MMGSLFKPDIPAPPAPPRGDDEVRNVRLVPIKNIDGTTTFATLLIHSTCDDVMANALREIEMLSSDHKKNASE